MVEREAVRRKERREGIALTAVGSVFAAAGVLLLVIGNPWMGVAGICFGAMGILTGIVTSRGESRASEIPIIFACLAFALTGVFMIISGIVTPAAWGWRGSGAGILAGALTFALFGPGTVILVIKRMQRRRASRSGR